MTEKVQGRPWEDGPEGNANRDNGKQSHPFSEGVWPLRRAGYLGTLPLPPRDKFPPPTGWTGEKAGNDWPGDDLATKWAADRTPSNIGVRLPFGVLGIDVDHYEKNGHDKRGGDSLDDLIARWGELPPTWRTTSRDDGVSGIRLFRVPVGLKWPGKAGDAIDLVHSGHRYAVVAPSVHPSGNVYRWVGPDGGSSELPPTLEELPELPSAWVQGLTNGGQKAEAVVSTGTTVADYLERLRPGDMCPYVLGLVAQAERGAHGANRHDDIKDTVMRLARAGEMGHAGVHEAVDTVQAIFLDAVGDEPGRGAAGEWQRMLSGAVDKIGARKEGKQCGCGRRQHPGEGDSKSKDLDRGQNRLAERLAREHGQNMRFIHGIGWHLWDGARWSPDRDGEPTRNLLETIRNARIEAAYLDESPRRELLKDAARGDSGQGIEGVLRVASTLHPITTANDAIDKNPHLFCTPNGTIDLRTGKVQPNNRGDLITKVSGAVVGTTEDVVWTGFLKRILPDEDVRRFVQRLIGYSMLGEVTEHIMPIFTGGGGNGKGTLRDAVLHAFGDYATEVDPELLMESKHARHGTFKMRLRGRRIVFSSETDKGRRFAEAMMKRLTGGDPIEANLMHRDAFSFLPSHTLILLTNKLPKVSGDDEAVWRRIRVVPFDVKITESEIDGNLPNRLRDAAPAVLRWALEGWLEYQRIGLAAPEAVLRSTGDYRSESDILSLFISERCDLQPTAREAPRDLYRRYVAYCDGLGERYDREREFFKKMEARGFEKIKHRGSLMYSGIGEAEEY